MTARGYVNGHVVYYDEDLKEWLYEDNDISTFVQKPCVLCNKPPSDEGHDACIANLPKVSGACCGHGVKTSYLVTEDEYYQEFEFTNTLRNDMVTWLNKYKYGLHDE